jgi:hypothetical protein
LYNIKFVHKCIDYISDRVSEKIVIGLMSSLVPTCGLDLCSKKDPINKSVSSKRDAFFKHEQHLTVTLSMYCRNKIYCQIICHHRGGGQGRAQMSS